MCPVPARRGARPSLLRRAVVREEGALLAVELARHPAARLAGRREGRRVREDDVGGSGAGGNWSGGFDVSATMKSLTRSVSPADRGAFPASDSSGVFGGPVGWRIWNAAAAPRSVVMPAFGTARPRAMRSFSLSAAR